MNGGNPGGKEQGDQGGAFLFNVRQLERFQVWEQRFATGTKLQRQEGLPGLAAAITFFEGSHPSNVSTESNPFRLRWEPLEIL